MGEKRAKPAPVTSALFLLIVIAFGEEIFDALHLFEMLSYQTAMRLYVLVDLVMLLLLLQRKVQVRRRTSRSKSSEVTAWWFAAALMVLITDASWGGLLPDLYGLGRLGRSLPTP